MYKRVKNRTKCGQLYASIAFRKAEHFPNFERDKRPPEPLILQLGFSLELVLQSRAKLEYRAVSNQPGKILAVLTINSIKEIPNVFCQR